jgi:hypothetical protein
MNYMQILGVALGFLLAVAAQEPVSVELFYEAG